MNNLVKYYYIKVLKSKSYTFYNFININQQKPIHANIY